MTWESRLVSTYCLLCKHSDLIYCSALRHSNNAEPAFTDIEVMTIYLYVSTRGGGYTTKKAIYDYANDHLRSWFPLLPKYHAFVQRCNHLESAMQLLGNALYADLAVNMPENNQFICEYLVDSLPIMMAKNQRCKTARVAPEIASVGYCATKKMAYYGLKIHAAGLMSAQKKLPLLSVMAITAASPHDLTGFKQDLARNCTNAKVYADSAIVIKVERQNLNNYTMSQFVLFRNGI